MAFNRKAQYGKSIPTVKDHETVTVQLVEVTDRQGGNPQMRVDVRIFANNGDEGGYTGPTKIGFMFNDPDALRDLADTLNAAADDAEAKGMAVATAAPVKAEVVPVVTVPARPSVAMKRVAAQRAAKSTTSTIKRNTK